MPILEGIKRSLNIAGIEIEITTDKIIYFQGDTIQGEVRLNGGEYEQSGTSVVINLVEIWRESAGKYQVTKAKGRDSQQLDEAFTLQPRDNLNYLFELKLPLNSRLSIDRPTQMEGWQLTVKVNVPGSKDPFDGLWLEVRTAPEIYAVMKAINEGTHFTGKVTDRIHYGGLEFKPSADFKRYFDWMVIRLTQQEEGLDGTLTLNLQEHSARDYLKALTFKDRIEFEFNLTATEIFLPDNRINNEAILAKINPIIEQTIAGLNLESDNN